MANFTAHEYNKELVTEKEDPLDEEQVFTDEERRLIREGVYEHTHRYYSFERRSKDEQAKAIDEALALK